MSKALVWLRRDLRLADHPALCAAAAAAAPVYPVYVHAPEEEAPWAPGAAGGWWLHHSLTSLGRQLRKRGAGLVIRRGPSVEALIALARETGATSVHWTRIYDPAPRRRDAAVARALRAAGIAVHEHPGYLLREPETILTGGQTPYRVFTPFSRTYADWVPDAPLEVPRLRRVPALSGLSPDDLGLLPKADWGERLATYWQPGEPQAQKRWESFLERADAYAARRDTPSANGVSRLSAALHFGELSPRQLYWQIKAHPSPGAAAYQRQLVWREFTHYLLWHFPHTPNQPFQDNYRNFPWRKDARLLARWRRGDTGLPMVDAPMRELWQSGYMHNRLRMLTAAFLCKQGGVDWRAGARWFWDTLVDANLANNTFGWQWSAGCGADAAPYFRIFNPVLQGRRWDAKGAYVRRWVPALREVAERYVHEPWRAAPPPAGYPPPCLDLAEARRLCLRRAKMTRGQKDKG